MKGNNSNMELTRDEKQQWLGALRANVGACYGLIAIGTRAGLPYRSEVATWVATGGSWYYVGKAGELEIVANLRRQLEEEAAMAEVTGPAFVEPPTAPAATTDTYDPPRLWNLLRTTWGAGTVLPDNSAQRKEFPIAEGFDGYFPAATVAVAGWSRMANNKHNPGQPLNHARGKSGDHADCQRRHQLDALDPKRDRLEELTCKAWRAMAELQEYAESLGAPPAPAATFPEGAVRRTEAGWTK